MATEEADLDVRGLAWSQQPETGRMDLESGPASLQGLVRDLDVRPPGPYPRALGVLEVQEVGDRCPRAHLGLVVRFKTRQTPTFIVVRTAGQASGEGCVCVIVCL